MKGKEHILTGHPSGSVNERGRIIRVVFWVSPGGIGADVVEGAGEGGRGGETGADQEGGVGAVDTDCEKGLWGGGRLGERPEKFDSIDFSGRGSIS